MHPDPTSAYLRWAATRAALWRGYWQVTAVYLVVVADLTPPELVLIGTGQALTVLVAEIPAGVLADTVSRRRSVVIAQVVTGAGMVVAGLVTTFPLLVVSQCLCGLGWAFASGADVAWLSDELGRPAVVDRVFASQARWELLAGPAGMVVFGALAYAMSLSVAIVVSGTAMAILAVVVARWSEDGFVRGDPGRRRHAAAAILGDGARLARVDRVIGAALVATVLFHGGFEAYGRLLQRHLLDLGLPADPHPIVWFTAIGLIGFALGAIALRAVQQHIDGDGAPQRIHAAMCTVGAFGLVLFAHAPSASSAVVGAFLVSGIADPVTRVTTTVWVNRRATREVRATVHSFVSQAEHLGEVVLGLTLAGLASFASAPVALTGSAALIVAAGAVALRSLSTAPTSTGRRRWPSIHRSGRRTSM
ncbi:MAG: MFS transporter [Acidimicrobiales bacterium]